MKTAAVFAALTLSAFADTPPLRDLLRDGLYAEEITRDKDAAAKQYEQIVARFNEQRPFAANAIFRLAEIRRSQNRKDEAIALYQLVVTQFPDADPQANLARTQLTAWGAQALESKTSESGTTTDEETKELQRLTELAQTSPDRLKPLQEIRNAASKGWDKVSRFLVNRLEGTAKQDGLNIGLMSAAGNGQLALCKSLLEQGADPNGIDGGITLSQAVWFDREEVVKLLLQKGANPNLTPKSCNPPRPTADDEFLYLGGALHAAAYRKNLSLLKHLLDAGADASFVAPGSGFAPLHLMLYGGSTKNLQGTRMLLEKGATPDAIVTVSGQSSSEREEYTPLRYAIRSGDLETVKLLIAAGATPKNPSYLPAACDSVPMIRLLLDHGADPTIPNLLQTAANKKGGVEAVQLLIERGATVDAEWKNSGFRDTEPTIRLALLERFCFPEWSSENKIRIVTPDDRSSRSNAPSSSSSQLDRLFPVVIDKNQDTLRPLAELLVGLTTARHNLSAYSDANQLTLYRKKPEGGFTTTLVRFDSTDPFPEPQWGDILWISQIEASYTGHYTSWSLNSLWSLLKHLKIPIEVEINDHKQALMMRGDCLSYDPTKAVCPWLTVDALVDLFTGSTGNPTQESEPTKPNPSIQVYRRGWPQPIELKVGSNEARACALQSSDRIVVRIPQEDREALRKTRLKEIAVTSPGLWFTKRFPAQDYATPPTLLQAITSAYPSKPNIKPYLSPLDMPKIYSWSSQRWGNVYLPYPDLSKIRIRRLNEQGEEQPLMIDLAKAAASCKEDTPSEEARKFDVELQLGDIVEIPVLPGKKDQTWSGFSEAESRLFAKALSCQVQFSDDESQTMRKVVYAPPQIIDTGYGLLAIPKGDGDPSLIASQIYGTKGSDYSNITVTLNRNGNESTTTFNRILVRQGDRIRISRQTMPQSVPSPNAPIQNRPPRQRILPPANR